MKDNTNVIKGALIFAVIFILILGVFVYLYHSERDNLIASTKDANTKAQDAQKKAQDAINEAAELKEIITGRKEDVLLKDIRDAHDKDMNRYGGAGVTNYQKALENIGLLLDDKKKEYETALKDRNQFEANCENMHKLYGTVVNKYAKEKEEADKERNDATTKYNDDQDKLLKDNKQIADSKEAALKEKDDLVKEAEDKANEQEKVANTLKLTNKELTQMKHELTRITFDRPHGLIESVNQQAKSVTINLGRADGLATRMTFTVYPPTITGISFMSADTENEANLCEVCRRERSLNASKASIEVTEILSEHTAKARILDDILTNPIVTGDVIYTPIWKPGQMQRFALAAGMKIPGVGQRDGNFQQSDLDTIRSLIRLNGGEVDAYISEGNDGNERGKLVGEINSYTTFLVLGNMSDDDSQDQEMMETQNSMRKTAEQYAVKVIGLKEFLTLSGWKNVTPVKGFGQYATESDLRILPRGGVATAPGTVSPIYTPRNDSALVSNDDRSVPSSSGTVSGIYGQGKVSASSSGTVSDLFRPRRPATNKDE